MIKKKFIKRWIGLLVVLLSSIFLLNLIEALPRFPSYLSITNFILVVLEGTFFSFFFLGLFAFIPVAIVLGVSYGIIKRLMNSVVEQKSTFRIITVTVIFAVYIITLLYSPLKEIGIERLFYPSLVLDSSKLGSDNWVPFVLARLVYGIIIGLIVGIIISIIRHYKKHEK